MIKIEETTRIDYSDPEAKKEIDDLKKQGRRENLVLRIKNEQNKAVDEIEMEFLGGPGVHFQGEVNCLTSEPSFGQKRYSIYAECEIPEDEDASEDYGYLTMKRRIEELLPKMLPDVKQLHFKYDGYEDRLENDANAACDVYCEFIDDDYGIFEQEVIMSWE